MTGGPVPPPAPRPDLPADGWAGEAAAALAARFGAPEVRCFARVGSTNDAARVLGEAGAPHGTTVLAEAQTAGRGRGGKAWASAAGLGAWLSLVARPREIPAPGLLPLVVGLAAARALEPFAGGAPVGVKWPNDLWIGGRKLGGVLCEAVWDGGGPRFVVVGIGVNVGHAPADFPPEVRASATSLRIAAGAAPLRAAVAGALVRALAAATERVPARLPGAALDALRARDALLGRRVRVEEAGAAVRGTAAGISPDGALLLRGEDGAVREVRSGSVRIEG